jgi:hypothetical protein
MLYLIYAEGIIYINCHIIGRGAEYYYAECRGGACNTSSADNYR